MQTEQLVSEEEIQIFEDLTPEEVFILGFLKGFNRQNMKMWSDMELSIFGEILYDDFD